MVKSIYLHMIKEWVVLLQYELLYTGDVVEQSDLYTVGGWEQISVCHLI